MDATKGDPEVLAKLQVGGNRGLRRWLPRGLVLALVLALAGGAYAYFRHKNRDRGERWVTAPVTRGDLRETVIATGTLSPRDSVQVGAEVTGRVIKVNVEVNDLVKEGQVIAELDPTLLKSKVEESQAQLNSAQASYASAQATAAEADATAKRKRELHDRGLTSDADLIAAQATQNRAKASIATAAAQISLARAGVKNSETGRAKAIIKSPIEGMVLARSVELGQTVTAGFQTPVLFTIGRDLTGMRLTVDVDEADVGKVSVGEAATFVVDAYPKRQFASKILFLSNMPKADTTVITYQAELTVDNAERLLRPGMTATATIVTSEKKGVLTVPNAALRFQPTQTKTAATGPPSLPIPGMGGGMMRRGGGGARPASSAGSAGNKAAAQSKDSVYVVEQQRLKRVFVEVLATDGKNTEVEGPGLTAGSEVVIDVVEAGE